jgi:hypothetical protein
MEGFLGNVVRAGQQRSLGYLKGNRRFFVILLYKISLAFFHQGVFSPIFLEVA